MWLDDVRACPDGWTHVKTVAEAKALLLAGPVEWASLDHDLGICPRCVDMADADIDARLCPKDCTHECHETGSDLVRWMAENDVWPRTKPRVHSANPVGAAYMRGVIERYWRSHDDAQ
jgi:hypothetical protein